MEGSAAHPFTVELEDGTVIGGAQFEADACVLAAGALSLVKGTLLVRDSSSAAVVAQIGRIQEDQPVKQEGPQIDHLEPASGDPNMPPQILTVKGEDFEDGAEILFDTAAIPTTFNDSTDLACRLQIEADAYASGERTYVQVRNPDGRASPIVYFNWD